jgi:hypothetical protein
MSKQYPYVVRIAVNSVAVDFCFDTMAEVQQEITQRGVDNLIYIRENH